MKRTASIAPVALLFLAALPAAASLPAGPDTGDQSSYGYLRTVEGPGRVVQAASGAPVEIEANYPVLAGDRLELDPGGRLELSLPDFNVVRLDGGSELELARLALSADSGDQATALRLLRGELQILVHDLLPVDDRPRVDTANATVYLQGSGVYRIATDGYGWTEVVVRDGFAEIATEAGSSVVRSGEQAWIEGGRWPRVDVERAGGLDELERWGAALDGEPAGFDDLPVEEHLAYSAAPLSRHGSWVTEDGYRAWRPAVNAGWRPYEAGYWADTPTGMAWVSSEPWGWVTYHYGSWVPSPSFGWVWRPGRRFAPAWVYWYWGPSYVAWVPVGYYSSHYRDYGRGFRFGVHGWAGGSWSYFADWTFCSTRSFRSRDLRRHVRSGHRLARDTRSFALERGLITTDSRRELRQRTTRGSFAGRAGGDSLPDVTAFVARRRELPPEVTERVFSSRRAVSRDELWEPADGSRPGTRSARAAVPRGDGRQTSDDWRRESGRLRGLSGAGAPRAAPRARAGAPGERYPAGSRWWESGSTRPATRGEGARPAGPNGPAGRPPATRTPSSQTPTAGRAAPRPGEARAPSDERPPVVRRVWEGIRDRQRARPTSPPPAAGARDPRAPARAPAAERRSAPPRASSTEGRSSPPPRQSTARSNDRGSSNRGSARSNRGSGRSNGSSEGSSRGRARRRPPA